MRCSFFPSIISEYFITVVVHVMILGIIQGTSFANFMICITLVLIVVVLLSALFSSSNLFCLSLFQVTFFVHKSGIQGECINIKILRCLPPPIRFSNKYYICFQPLHESVFFADCLSSAMVTYYSSKSCQYMGPAYLHICSLCYERGMG